MQEFVDAAKHLSTKRVSNEEVTTYFHEVANLPEFDEDEDKKAPKVVRMFQECLENGPGQRLDTSLGTWRGAVNAGLMSQTTNLAALATTATSAGSAKPL